MVTGNGVFVNPIQDMLGRLGINKVASTQETSGDSNIDSNMSDEDLAKELEKMAAGTMPEQQAGKPTDGENVNLDSPEGDPVKPVIENGKDNAKRDGVAQVDDLGKIEQTSAPLGSPEGLDKNQDPLAVAAEKIASTIEAAIGSVESKPGGSTASLNYTTTKIAAPLNWFSKLKANAVPLAGGFAAGGALGGGLGFMGGKAIERKKDEKEDSAIFDLGAQVGGQLAAQSIVEQLANAAQTNGNGDQQ